MNERSALEYLLKTAEAAIKAGDWKVDGACDPDLAIRVSKIVLDRPEKYKVSPTEFISCVLNKEDMTGKPVIWAEWPEEKRK